MAVRNLSPDKNESAESEVTPGTPSDLKGKAQQLASSVVLQAKDVATDVGNKAQDWAGNVADKAQETASAVMDKTNAGIAAVGHQMSAVGGTVRDAGHNHGVVGSVASAVADELQAGGHYLEGHGLDAISKDLTDVVRQYPIPSVLIGFGLGCLIGMTLLQRRS